jgi:hypothetical protein
MGPATLSLVRLARLPPIQDDLAGSSPLIRCSAKKMFPNTFFLCFWGFSSSSYFFINSTTKETISLMFFSIESTFFLAVISN